METLSHLQAEIASALRALLVGPEEPFVSRYRIPKSPALIEGTVLNEREALVFDGLFDPVGRGLLRSVRIVVRRSAIIDISKRIRDPVVAASTLFTDAQDTMAFQANSCSEGDRLTVVID